MASLLPGIHSVSCSPDVPRARSAEVLEKQRLASLILLTLKFIRPLRTMDAPGTPQRGSEERAGGCTDYS